jgi:hypothetical protein
MPIEDKNKSLYDILNDPHDPFGDGDVYSSPIDFSLLSDSNNNQLKKLREKQNLNDKVNQKMVKPYIQRVAKQMDNPRATNPQMLWNVKRQNHKLLKSERNPKLREKLTNEILQADEQLLKNIDEEVSWMTEEKKKIEGEITSKQTKGQTNVEPKPIK